MRKVTVEEVNEKLKKYGVKVEMVNGKLVKVKPKDAKKT